MTEDQKNHICEFRYSIIAELANPHLSFRELNILIKEKAKRKYDVPYSDRKNISEFTIKDWLSKYKKLGKPGLRPKTRNDKGKSKSITDKDQDAIIKYLESNKETKGLVALDILKAKGVIDNNITSSSFCRFLQSVGLDKKNRNDYQKNQENTRKFNFKYPLECVQADCMHAFEIPDENGKLKKAILISFLDDATRRIVYSNFSFSEQSVEFEKGIKHILKTHGKIHRLYVDNGSTFISLQTERILRILDIILIHSKPYRPCGRGKKERFYRTARDRFIRPLDKDSIKNIADLNMKFKIWLETEYHRNPHRGLENHTPLDVWLSKTEYLISMNPTIDIDKAFFHENTRKVYKDSTIIHQNVLYEVPSILIGKTIKMLYDPTQAIKVLEIYYDGKFYGESRPVDCYANTKVIRNQYNKSVDIKKDKNLRTHIESGLNASQIQIGE